MTTLEILQQAKSVKTILALADTQLKNDALNAMADALIEDTDLILAANQIDLAKAKGTISEVMLDRLALSESRIQGMAQGVREVAELPDPVNTYLESFVRPNGMEVNKVLVPMGVIAIIYESRPNVTSDAAALALKSGNAVVLRCGKEAHTSAEAIVKALRKGLTKVGLPMECINLVEDTTRESARVLMTANDYVDLLFPRGGKGLIKSCVENATVPCIETGTGICHVYVDEEADIDMALTIIENAKTSRPSVCNAEEVCLVAEKMAPTFLPLLKEKLTNREKPVELRLDEKAQKIIEGTPATDLDFDTEFLDYILAIKVVKDAKEAIEHISIHSTHHSDCIITNNETTANLFLQSIDSAAVYWNVSTRFTDGGEFGLGCEMGISTQKLQARGPMGLKEFCTYKYIIKGKGQIR